MLGSTTFTYQKCGTIKAVFIVDAARTRIIQSGCCRGYLLEEDAFTCQVGTRHFQGAIYPVELIQS